MELGVILLPNSSMDHAIANIVGKWTMLLLT